MFDYNQMLNEYASKGMYSAKAEQEALQAARKAKQDEQKAAKEAEKQAKQIPSTGCGNYSCRICYGIFGKAAFAAQEQDRKRAEKDVQDFMQERRSSRIDQCVERVIRCAHGEISI
jgi:hypothetical protein